MLLYVLMILFAVVMFWGLNRHKRKGDAWARPVAAVGGILTLVMAVSTMFRGADDEFDRGISQAWQQVQVEYLGHYLAEHHAGTDILLIHDPSSPTNEMDQLLAAFEQQIAGNLQIVATITPPQETDDPTLEGTIIPMDMVSAEALDDLLNDYSGYEMIVSLCGLPMDYQDLELWRLPANKRPTLALVNGPIYELKKAIDLGLVVAGVAWKPDSGFELVYPPEDLQAAFDSRYLLVTPNNLAEVESTYPNLFMED